MKVAQRVVSKHLGGIGRRVEPGARSERLKPNTRSLNASKQGETFPINRRSDNGSIAGKPGDISSNTMARQ